MKRVSSREMASMSLVEKMLGKELAGLESLPNDTSSSSMFYKVPQTLHDANKDAFAPKVISIGPYHCRSKNLQAMNSWKKRYLQSFLKRSGLELGTCVNWAQGWEEKVRGYYDDEECERLDSDELVQMILMDGIFIVEFTWQWYNQQGSEESLLFKQSSILRDNIMRDLMLLENQLPFFVLKELADNSNFPGNNNNNNSSSREWMVNLTKLFHDHFDLMQTSAGSNRPPSVIPLVGFLEITGGILHLVDFIHDIVRIPFLPTSSVIFRGPTVELSRSATELQQAGVKLGCAQDLFFTRIFFMENIGFLQIPHLVVNRNTESLFRNIIAHEHCHSERGSTFRSYVILMNCLINTSQDVQLLVNLGIINNSLGTNEDVSTLFNNLYKMPMMGSSEFFFAELCQTLNKYSRDPWHKLKARWCRWKLTMRDYFIAGSVLLGLAIIQTLCSIIQTLCSIKGIKW